MTERQHNGGLPPRFAEWLLAQCLPNGIAEKTMRCYLREETDAICS
mgnify:FL=1